MAQHFKNERITVKHKIIPKNDVYLAKFKFALFIRNLVGELTLRGVTENNTKTVLSLSHPLHKCPFQKLQRCVVSEH